MLAYLFPGQGSQVRGMGNNLFDIFKDYTAQANDILGYSIQSLCLHDADQQLHFTQYTQPAIYVVNALTYLKNKQDVNEKPDYVAGHSLGEYNALFAAGVFDFATGLKLVKKRGELMSQAEGGGMAAILGLNREALHQLLQQHALSSVHIANDNSPSQLVISGMQDNIKQAQAIFAKIPSATFIPLKVSGAFHSPYMSHAQSEFEIFLRNFHFDIPSIPVIANVNALPYHPRVIKQNLIDQITGPVEWVNTIQYLKSKKVLQFKEIGVGTVLTRLMG